jgi:hypothetical protein
MSLKIETNARRARSEKVAVRRNPRIARRRSGGRMSPKRKLRRPPILMTTQANEDARRRKRKIKRLSRQPHLQQRLLSLPCRPSRKFAVLSI